MTKKRTAALAVCALLLFCVIAAGCSGPTASPTPSTATNSSTQGSKAAVSTPTASATISTPTPSVSPTPSSSPSAGGPASLTVQYFYETNCPICQNFSWRVNQLEQDYLGKVTVVRISNPDAGVSTVPTLVLLNHETEVGRWVNPPDTTGIYAQINSLLYAS